ncbi:MAG: GH32 C-terminal domain-containing protein [Verrucomicrobia bacterium]|nr:GH32 C-terminal domain-containing protein [Verrucomicrobiota bacterium]
MITIPLIAWIILFAGGAAAAGADKTLVSWVCLANTTQQGGSALTLQSGSQFDGIVFGEKEAGKWMAGSETFSRTQVGQQASATEKADSQTLIQMAIVYAGNQITIYRNGVPYASYEASNIDLLSAGDNRVVFGLRHHNAGEVDTLRGWIEDARIYDRALSADEIRKLEPKKESTPKPYAWWTFEKGKETDLTGRFPVNSLSGGAKIEGGRLLLPVNGATLMASANPLAAAAKAPEVSVAKLAPPPPAPSLPPVADDTIRAARSLRERFLADPYRPGYHFCAPEDMGKPGDPNGAFYHNGRYHLMYLYNRNGSGFCWGHISSADLVHWRHHPDAIGPGHGDEGCYSGGAFVDDDGTAYLSYWMLWGAKGIGLAKSQGADFSSWSKLEANPIIKSTEWGVTEVKNPDGSSLFYGSADPSNIWKKNGRYYMLTGNLLVLEKIGRAPGAPLSEQGDRLYLFVSDDLKTWKYLHVFYERKPEWTDRSEDNMCPSFLPLPSKPEGGPASGKHLLLFISHNKGCQYYVGEYRDDRFFPDNHGRMSWVDNTYFAPEALIDGQRRQIMWAWLIDNPSGEKEKGWSGVYGLPRSLWLGDDGTLRMRPVKELESLRSHEKSWNALTVADGKTKALEGVAGSSCELGIEIEVGTAQRCGLKVRASGDGQEETLLYYDAKTKELVFDSTRSGGDGRKVVERAPLALKPGELLKLRVFVDKPVVEVFANDRQAICRRVYPARSDSLGVVVFADGGQATFNSVKAWEMAPSNPY